MKIPATPAWPSLERDRGANIYYGCSTTFKTTFIHFGVPNFDACDSGWDEAVTGEQIARGGQCFLVRAGLTSPPTDKQTSTPDPGQIGRKLTLSALLQMAGLAERNLNEKFYKNSKDSNNNILK